MPGTDGRTRYEDRWSARFPLAAGVVVLAFWYAGLKASLLIGFSAFIAAAGIAIAGSVTCLALLFSRRWRGAASASSAPFVIAIGVIVTPAAVEQAQVFDFAQHRSHYEETVRTWKTDKQDKAPFRLVVDGVDRSVFLTNIFDDIVYDESDAVGSDPEVFSGIWACAIPGWGSEVMMVGNGRKSVKPLGGHFYLVNEVD